MLNKTELLSVGWQHARDAGPRYPLPMHAAPGYVRDAADAWMNDIVFLGPCRDEKGEWGLIAHVEGEALIFDPEFVLGFDFKV